MPYKMLALDLDNTLLYKDLTMAPAAGAALARLMSRGIFVTLATGRMYPSAAYYAKLAGVTGPLACYNGALIQSAQSGGYRLARPLSVEKARDIAAFCRRKQYYVQLYNNDRILVEKRTKETEIDPDLIHNSRVEIGDLTQAEYGPTPKMIVVAPPERTAGIRQEFEEEFGASVTLAASKDYLVEIMDKGVSKASALAIICQNLGIQPEEVVCCGDNSNDAAMIQWAGLGAAVGNAAPAIKQIADYVAQETYGDAVAEVIGKFFG